ncbi:MAG: AAA family ATPase [Bacteriovorax sp.]|nr:AAA family ATPase [Bacteriovorax sp.]
MDTNNDLLKNINNIKKILYQMELNHLEEKKQNTLNNVERNKQFKNFATGPSNQLAYNAAFEVTTNIGANGKYPAIFIQAENGLGKTHLLNAITNRLNDKHPELTVKMTNARNLMDEMINFMKVNRISNFFENNTSKINVLIIDDIQELKNKEGTQEQFLLIVKELQRTGKQIVFASDDSPKELHGISNKLLSHFQKSLIVDIQKPDLETSVLILEMISKKISLTMRRDLLLIVGENTEPNPAHLEGALLRIKAASELMNTEITEEFIKKELSLI